MVVLRLKGSNVAEGTDQLETLEEADSYDFSRNCSEAEYCRRGLVDKPELKLVLVFW